MDPFEAAEAIRLLGVKNVVPTHYGTFRLLAGTPHRCAMRPRTSIGLEVLDVEAGGTVR